MNFYSDAGQDQFVANLLKFKRDGFCVDIGSCHSMLSNNTYVFQGLGWTSVSVEINSRYNESYGTRLNGTHYNEDALKMDYKKAFVENDISNVRLGTGKKLHITLSKFKNDMRSADIDFLTIGQYLQPTIKHHKVEKFVHPDEFDSELLDSIQSDMAHPGSVIQKLK